MNAQDQIEEINKKIEELQKQAKDLEKTLKEEKKFIPGLYWVSDSQKIPDKDCHPQILVSYKENAEYHFCNEYGIYWKYATPLTREECLSLCAIKSRYDWEKINREFPQAYWATMDGDGRVDLWSKSRNPEWQLVSWWAKDHDDDWYTDGGYAYENSEELKRSWKDSKEANPYYKD